MSGLAEATIVLTATTAGTDIVRLSNNGADAMTVTVIAMVINDLHVDRPPIIRAAA